MCCTLSLHIRWCSFLLLGGCPFVISHTNLLFFLVFFYPHHKGAASPPRNAHFSLQVRPSPPKTMLSGFFRPFISSGLLPLYPLPLTSLYVLLSSTVAFYGLFPVFSMPSLRAPRNFAPFKFNSPCFYLNPPPAIFIFLMPFLS